jgi:hypothetical protein
MEDRKLGLIREEKEINSVLLYLTKCVKETQR